MNIRRSLILLVTLLAASLAGAPAFGSAIIGRDVTGATLSIDWHCHSHGNYRSEVPHLSAR